MKYIIILLLLALQVNAQKRNAWWRPTLVYKKDSTLDTVKTSANLIKRVREMWQDDTTTLTVTPDIITSLLETQKKNQTTKYKKGFQYTENRSGMLVKLKLLEWIPTGTDFDGLLIYRWRVRGYIPLIKRSFLEYTDDAWIDIDIGIAYIDECDHKIKYYDQK